MLTVTPRTAIRFSVRQGERLARGLPEVAVERAGGEGDRSSRLAVVGVADLHPDPAGDQAAAPEAAAQPLGQPPQERVQHAEIVGVGGEDVLDAQLGEALGRQHRARIDAQRPRPQRAARVAEDGAERTLGNRRHLADQIELVVVEPGPDPRMQVGEHDQRMGREESGLDPEGHDQRVPLRAVRLPACPPVRPDHRLAHQLVGGDADREGEAEPAPDLPLHPRGDIDRRAEQPVGAGQVEIGVAVAARLDDGSVGAEDLMQRARSAGIEPGVGRDDDQVGALLQRLPHHHASLDAGAPRLRRKREHHRPLGAGRRHRHRAGCERGGDQRFDRGAEGGGIDEEDGARQARVSLASGFIRYS